MKNKKGFTLIELLVTIALMLSILGIAIVSFINVSNKKKEEAWEKVKNQTELAAEEYFNDNAYYLTGEKSARVSIGKLVSENYLNIVTNPITGKAVNNCDYVDVTYSENGYSYKYVENTNNKVCDTDNYIITSEVGAPEIDVKLTNKVSSTGWYITDTKIKATVKQNGNGAIASVKYCTTSSGNCDNYQSLSLTKDNVYNVTNYKLSANKGGVDGESVRTTFTATNTAGKTVIGYVTYKKDTENPVCASNNGSTTWTNSNRTITWNCKDNTSKCVKNKYSKKFEKSTQIGYQDIYDNAGNKTQCSANVYLDKDAPTCEVSLSGEKGENGWFIKNDVNVSLSYSDGLSGVASHGLTIDKKASYNSIKKDKQTNETAGTKWYGYVRDAAGNKTSCNNTVKLEKVATLDLDIDTMKNIKNSSKNTVFNKNYDGTMPYSDTNSKNCVRSYDNKGCAVDIGDSKYYFGVSCMDVHSFDRTFTKKDAKGEGSVSWTGETTFSKGLERITSGGMSSYSKMHMDKINGQDNTTAVFNKTYKTGTLNNKGTKINFTMHTFRYKSEAGNYSNYVVLYTQYSINCDYK